MGEKEFLAYRKAYSNFRDFCLRQINLAPEVETTVLVHVIAVLAHLYGVPRDDIEKYGDIIKGQMIDYYLALKEDERKNRQAQN